LKINADKTERVFLPEGSKRKASFLASKITEAILEAKKTGCFFRGHLGWGSNGGDSKRTDISIP